MTIPKTMPTIPPSFPLFLSGFVLGAFTIRHPSAALAASSSSPCPSEADAPKPASPQEDDDCVCFELAHDYDLRAKYNGWRLPLDRANLSKDEQTRILRASQVT